MGELAMMERVFLIHGWSVQETTTYQALHNKLAEHGFDLREIYLGRYVSLENEVEIRDIARALHQAIQEQLHQDWSSPFHIITHSTGALVAKQWIVRHYTGEFVERKPLRNIVFLAGPHFGSRLAHHGRSMLAQAAYRGDTGREVLKALELSSRFSWQINEAWLNPANWQNKGLYPFNLIGDRVQKRLFQSKIFPAGYAKGSDMVVRVAAGNLNFKRFRLSHRGGKLNPIGVIENVPFAALANYTHSGPKHGIMNSITSRSTPENHFGLRLILECLKVRTEEDYNRLRGLLAEETRKTRKKRPGYAQLDLRFSDEEGQPINDYVFKLGAVVEGRRKPSKTVAHIHKNKIDSNHLTAFIQMKELEPKYTYFIEIDSSSESELFSYSPAPFSVEAPAGQVTEIITEDQTTQIDIVLSREPSRDLFVFHRGDDPDLHVRWSRRGEIIKSGLKHK
jgi:hypothetical protein